MTRLALAEEIAAVVTIARQAGLGAVAPAVVKAGHHTTLLLEPRGVVARVQSAEPVVVARRRAAIEVAVARHLARHAAPVLAPFDPHAGPHVVGECVVTFWPWVADARVAEDADAGVAAATLARAHRALLDYRGDLPPYEEALDWCRTLLTDAALSPALTPDDRRLLQSQLRRLRDAIEAISAPQMPLHGDAHLGNLLLAPTGPMWIDWEDACRGPREYDIACLPPAAWPLFDGVDAALVALFADLRSVSVATWCSADLARSPAMAEAAAYHLDRVRERAAAD